MYEKVVGTVTPAPVSPETSCTCTSWRLCSTRGVYGGDTHLMSEGEQTVTDGAGTPPNRTVRSAVKPAPRSQTAVPPSVDPSVADTSETSICGCPSRTACRAGSSPPSRSFSFSSVVCRTAGSPI